MKEAATAAAEAQQTAAAAPAKLATLQGVQVGAASGGTKTVQASSTITETYSAVSLGDQHQLDMIQSTGALPKMMDGTADPSSMIGGTTCLRYFCRRISVIFCTGYEKHVSCENAFTNGCFDMKLLHHENQSSRVVLPMENDIETIGNTKKDSANDS